MANQSAGKLLGSPIIMRAHAFSVICNLYQNTIPQIQIKSVAGKQTDEQRARMCVFVVQKSEEEWNKQHGN